MCKLLLANPDAFVLQAVAASDRTLRRQKVAQTSAVRGISANDTISCQAPCLFAVKHLFHTDSPLNIK